MMNSIVVMVVQTIASLLAGMCLLRAYMLWLGLRVGLGNSAGAWVVGLTDWLVLPLRRILPKAGRIDLGSLVAAFLVMLLQAAVIALLFELSAPPAVYVPVNLQLTNLTLVAQSILKPA